MIQNWTNFIKKQKNFFFTRNWFNIIFSIFLVFVTAVLIFNLTTKNFFKFSELKNTVEVSFNFSAETEDNKEEEAKIISIIFNEITKQFSDYAYVVRPRVIAYQNYSIDDLNARIKSILSSQDLKEKINLLIKDYPTDNLENLIEIKEVIKEESIFGIELILLIVASLVIVNNFFVIKNIFWINKIQDVLKILFYTGISLLLPVIGSIILLNFFSNFYYLKIIDLINILIAIFFSNTIFLASTFNIKKQNENQKFFVKDFINNISENINFDYKKIILFSFVITFFVSSIFSENFYVTGFIMFINLISSIYFLKLSTYVNKFLEYVLLEKLSNLKFNFFKKLSLSTPLNKKVNKISRENKKEEQKTIKKRKKK